MKPSVIVLLFWALNISLFSQFRYTDSIFTSSQTDVNRKYATAQELNFPYSGESSTHATDLTMHIFQPLNDTLSYRPAIIMIHGGAFSSGSKENQDMMEFCKLFAQKGYVTATISYRLGMNLASTKSSERAVYRALQDCRAAVRFMKDKRDELKIDTSNIYLIGSSAGAFMSLLNLFMNEENERPSSSYAITTFPPTLDNGPDLGKLDAIESQLKHSPHPRAIVSLWGALSDTSLIKPSDAGRPVFLIHGTADEVVPFKTANPFHNPLFPLTQGSYPINKRLQSLGISRNTYFVEGAGHEFYGVLNGNWNPAPNAYWDTINTKITEFFHKIHKPKAEFSFDAFDGVIHFNDQSTDAVKWLWNFGDDSTSTEQNPIHEYNNNGTYKVSLLVQNQIDSWDTISTNVDVVIISTEKPELLNNFVLKQNYPNPFNPSTVISYNLPSATYVTLKIFNILGQEITTLVSDYQSYGIYKVKFDSTEHSKANSFLPSGIYFYQLTTEKFTETKKMLLVQ